MEWSPEHINTMVFAVEKMQIANRRQLAEVFGVNEGTIREWRKLGMPTELAGDKGVENQFHVAACVAWLLGREFERLTRETPRDRLDRARADMMELELAQKMGTLVIAEEMEKQVEFMIAACRAELLSLGSKLAQKLSSIYQVDIDDGLIDEDVHAALKKLSRMGEDRSENHVIPHRSMPS